VTDSKSPEDTGTPQQTGSATDNPVAPSLRFVREEDFESLYANNVQLEVSVWDLKLIFGELDQRTDPATINQHTSVSIPWIQVKLLSYLLQANMALYENRNGPIRIPPEVVPPAPQTVFDENFRNDPHTKPAVDFITALHALLVRSSTVP
jgi:hypothetical protein